MKYKLERHKGFKFDLGRAALIVIDMQRYFTDPDSHAYIPSSPKIIAPINLIIDTFYKNKRPVIFTRHIDVDKNNMMSRWWQDSIKESDPLSELNSLIHADKGKIIVKHSYDAFMGTGLEEMLRSKDVEQVVVCGVVAHLCCETTARSAFTRNFVTWFVTDGTTSYDREHYEAALFNLAHGFAIPVESGELLIPA